MKPILTALLTITTLASHAQTRLTPGKDSFEKKWIANEKYAMNWYAIKDTTKFEIGTVSTEILAGKKNLSIFTNVKMKNSAAWIDTSIAHLHTLKPLYHSSFNAQRDMVLHFGKMVTGFYRDKQKALKRVISDTTNEKYFDSNLYPVLIRWLPLTEGFTKEIIIYDYNPSAKMGVLKATIKNVESGTYRTSNSGNHDVWLVTVVDEIGSAKDSFSTYYIDKADRKLWKQEINAGGRKMLMQRLEE